MPVRPFITAAVLCAALLAGGCVYRINIQQGNEITRQMISELEVGMTKREVTRIMGLPLITDPFHKDRWDYYYSFKSGESGEITSRQASLLFEDDLLSHVTSSFDEE